MIKYGAELGDWKTAELAAQEGLPEAQGDQATALAHYQFATVLMTEGLSKFAKTKNALLALITAKRQQLGKK